MTAITQVTAQNQGVWGGHFNSGSGGEADSQENDSFWQALSAHPAAISQATATPTLKQIAESQKPQPLQTQDQDEEELGLDDFLDVINPLHHIPVVSTFYRELSGDEISQPARVAGGVLFGGPIGAGFAVANIAVEAAVGQDIGASVLAMFKGDGASGLEPTAMVAKADPKQQTLPAPAMAPATPQPNAPANAAQTAAAPEGVQSAAMQNVTGSRLDAFIAKHAQKAGGGFDPASVRAEPRYKRPDQDVTASAPPPLPPIPGKSSDPSEISNWMLRTLDQYQHMKKGTLADDG